MTASERDAPAGRAAAPAGTAAQPSSLRGGAAMRAPISSDALFAGANEVQIVHRGALYRLKQTSLGKLILTK